MTYDLVSKRGIPVLVYSASDATLQWTCSLVVKHSKDRMQATISLESSIPVDGFDDKPTLAILFNADNLVPGKTSLGRSTIRLQQDQFNRIARQRKSQLRTLSLAVKRPCPIFCRLPSVGTIGPKPGFESRFHQFVKLTSATEVNILFDYGWVPRRSRILFQRLISHPEALTGLPVDKKHAKLHWVPDRSVFVPAEHAVSGALPSHAETLVPPSLPPPPPSSPLPHSTNISSLHTLIGAQVAAHARAHLEKIYADTLDHAAYRRGVADVEFHEFLDQEMLEVTMVKDDAIMELDDIIDDSLTAFEGSVAKVVKDIDEYAKEVYIDICGQLDELEGRRRLRCDRGRRAVSLPL